MLYVFWQNILSIHQSAFLRNLAEKNDVILVVETELTGNREKQGWNIPDLGKTQIVIAPNKEQINKLLEQKESIHIFSGVQAYKMPNEAFKIAVKKRLLLGVFSEPYRRIGIKGKLRFVKYLFFRLKYSKYICFILTTGKRGRWCFESVGFNKAIIYDWAYFTETPTLTIQENKEKDIKILFVGIIDARKNILPLIHVCKKLNTIDQLQIVGKGPLEKELLQAIQNTECHYLGNVSNQEVQRRMTVADVLILPSIHDGWGAVVNEALMCGTPVIASENCGSSILLNGIRGRVFSIEKNDLEEVLRDFVVDLPYNIAKRNEIRSWALQNISGESAARYFDDIVKHVTNENAQRPVAPWLISE